MENGKIDQFAAEGREGTAGEIRGGVMVEVESRIVGGLLGVAAGDALGATLEFMSPSEIRRRIGVHRDITGGGALNWKPGEGTDDTDLTWAVLSAYLDGPYTLQRVADNMLEWLDSNPTDIGGATSRALGRLKRTGDPLGGGNTGESSCGNGSLMRCIPTALARTDHEARRQELAEISAITHAHVRCADSCIAYGEIVDSLLDGASAADALASARCLDLDEEVMGALDIDPALDVERLRTGGYVIDSLACSVWAIQQNGSFEDVLVALVNRGKDADTTGAIAGGLLGVLHGVEAIPSRWRTALEYHDRLMASVPTLLVLREGAPAGGPVLPAPSHDRSLDMDLAGGGEMGPTGRSYWVIPGRFAAGAYPNPAPRNDKVGELLDAGINLFVNLTQDYPGGTDSQMNRYDIRAAEQHATVVRRDIADNGVTSRDEMIVTLDVIDQHLRDGCNVYVHCWGGSGRTGTVVGCWLRRHGYAQSGEVIDLLRRLRVEGDRKGGHKPTPQTGAQHRMVLEWPYGR